MANRRTYSDSGGAGYHVRGLAANPSGEIDTPAFPGSLRPRKGRYTLAELIAQCDPDAPAAAEDAAWLHAPHIGREAL